jgi:hypothetical protein
MASEEELRQTIVNELTPVSSFSGSFDQINLRQKQIIDEYENKLNSLPSAPTIPTIPTIVPKLNIPAFPSYAELKTALYNKMQQIRQGRREVSNKIAVQGLTEYEADPFGYTKNLNNTNRLKKMNVRLKRPSDN